MKCIYTYKNNYDKLIIMTNAFISMYVGVYEGCTNHTITDSDVAQLMIKKYVSEYFVNEENLTDTTLTILLNFDYCRR